MNKPKNSGVYHNRKKEMAEDVVLSKDHFFPGEKAQASTEKKMSEREILGMVQKGDREAYETIVKKYMHSAYYIALGLVHNQQDALDVSQDAFIKAFRKIRLFDNSKPFFPWFYRLLKNLCLDHLKRKKRVYQVPLEEISVLDEDRKDKELREMLWKGMEKLPLEQREVIIFRYFRQFSYAEIAELLGKPVGSVMSSLYYAKKKLKVILGKYLGFEKEK
jgi:RNA polymerase sigma-70 factor (ECF subfamily)